MPTTPAAARLARIAAHLGSNHEGVRAFVKQERETLRDLCGFAALNGGRSVELEAQVQALKAFLSEHPAFKVDMLAA